jgi:hypothetical protein
VLELARDIQRRGRSILARAWLVPFCHRYPLQDVESRFEGRDIKSFFCL